MKPLSPILFAALLTTTLSAQEAAQTSPAKPSSGKAPAAAAAQPNPEELMKSLFNPQATQEELEDAIKKAGMAGIPRQQLIEAKLVWGLRQQNVAWLEKMVPELEIVASNFDPQQSAGFKAQEIKSFISYIKALQADAKNDSKAFKEHILEAFWLFPSQAQLYTQIIEKRRLEEKMAQLKVDLSTTVTTYDGQATTLSDQLAGKKGLLVDFWASWCGPCMQLMPELKKKAGHLAKYDIVVAGMNKDDADAQTHAAKSHEELDIEFPWLIEPKERPFTKLLEIESIPRMILISPEGKVLFNGHPQDPALWVALKKLNPEIKEN